MINILKNLFNTIFKPIKIVKQENVNSTLIENLSNVIYIDNLEDKLFSPIAKIYLLNVYNDTFEDFLSNILIKNNSKQLIAVNVHSYFRDKENLQYRLQRLIPILETNKIDIKVEYELNELISTIQYIQSLGD